MAVGRHSARPNRPIVKKIRVESIELSNLATELFIQENGRSEVGYFSLFLNSWSPQNELRHGWGIQTWQDGARYEGNWLNDKAYGHGKFVHGEFGNDKSYWEE